MVAAKKKAPKVLADHTKVGKKFIPPFVAILGPLGEVRWVNDLVPELVWLALLSNKHGLKAGADLARQLALATIDARGAKPKKWFAVASAYAELDASEQKAVLAKLEEDGALEQIREALSPLLALYPQCPLSFLFTDIPQSEDSSLEEFKQVLASIFDRWDTPGTFVQAMAVYIAFVTDMLKVAEGLALANFPAIEEFPKTEESQRVASSARSVVSTFYGNSKDDQSAAWISYFWKRGLELDECEFETETGMTDEGVDLKEVMAIVDDLVQGLRAELQARWDAWDLDLTKSYLHDVIGGLMARQVTLATQLAQAPPIWNGHIAPLILRAMADAYITLAWIFQDPEKRADDYVKYGLGQRKLWLEHFKASLVEKGEEEPEKHPVVKAVTEQLNAERFEHLTEVSVGSWSEQSTRRMAEEAGCLDLYRLAYTPFSTAVHNMWTHVADYNLRRCQNPLHQFHRVPEDPELEPSINYVYRAAKYVAKTFDLFDRETGVSLETPSSFDSFVEALLHLTGEPPADSPDPLDDT